MSLGGEVAGLAQALHLLGIQVFAGDRAQVINAQAQIVKPFRRDMQCRLVLLDVALFFPRGRT